MTIIEDDPKVKELNKTIHELWMKIWLMEEKILELRRDLYYANLKLDEIEEEEETTPTEPQTEIKTEDA